MSDDKKYDGVEKTRRSAEIEPNSIKNRASFFNGYISPELHRKIFKVLSHPTTFSFVLSGLGSSAALPLAYKSVCVVAGSRQCDNRLIMYPVGGAMAFFSYVAFVAFAGNGIRKILPKCKQAWPKEMSTWLLCLVSAVLAGFACLQFAYATDKYLGDTAFSAVISYIAGFMMFLLNFDANLKALNLLMASCCCCCCKNMVSLENNKKGLPWLFGFVFGCLTGYAYYATTLPAIDWYFYKLELSKFSKFVVAIMAAIGHGAIAGFPLGDKTEQVFVGRACASGSRYITCFSFFFSLMATLPIFFLVYDYNKKVNHLFNFFLLPIVLGAAALRSASLEEILISICKYVSEASECNGMQNMEVDAVRSSSLCALDGCVDLFFKKNEGGEVATPLLPKGERSDVDLTV